VQIVIRHGDRTPVSAELNDGLQWDTVDAHRVLPMHDTAMDGQVVPIHIVPETSLYYQDRTRPYDKPPDDDVYPPGKLTSKGAQQHMLLGAALRNIYVDQLAFLAPTYASETAEQLYLRSTDVWRTKQSAASLALGLYPPNQRQEGVTMSLYIYREVYETMTSPLWIDDNICPRLHKLSHAIKHEAAYLALKSQHSELHTRLIQVLGVENEARFVRSLIPLNDVLRTRHCHGFALPVGITEQDVHDVGHALNQEYRLLRRDLPQSKEINKLEQGAFLGELVDAMQQAMTGQHGPKLRVYSGHDATVYGLLGNLESLDMNWPPYAANIILELWRTTRKKEYVVRLLYNGRPLTCSWWDFSTPCAWSVFANHVESCIPRRFHECCAG
jgi:acid phosphatase